MFAVPSFLLPHHEYILPPSPPQEDKEKLAQEIDGADRIPETIQAEHQLEQEQMDEANVKMSITPVCQLASTRSS